MEIRFNDPAAGDRIAELAGCAFTLGREVCFSSHRADGAFLGGFILTGYTGASMTIHIGSTTEKWGCPDLLWVAFHYPFVQLGCTSLIGPVPDYNTDTLAFALKMGFELETAIRGCFPGGGNMLITRMWREKCKWLHIQPRRLRFRGSFGDMTRVR